MLPKVSVENPRGRFARVFPWLVLVAAVSVMGVGGYSFNLQKRNALRLLDYADEIRALRDRSGTLPTSFVGHKDEWGHEVLYLHNDQHFVLVSFGSNGEPGEPSYAYLLTDSPPPPFKMNCFMTWLDTVAVDSRLQQACAARAE
jgi:hypothetical protein